MSTNCIFCKIINGKAKAEKVYEDDDVIVIKDISPKAPIHLLIIPKNHIPTLNDLYNNNPSEGKDISALLLKTAQKMAVKNGVDEDGYRLILNCNSQGGQSVYHLHMHFLAGKQMHGF